MAQEKSKYDPFFSRSMEHRPIAQAFFGQHLLKHTPQPVELDTLMRIDRTNTNNQLEQRRRDIAYKAQMQGGSDLLACAEHQGREDITMPTRFLTYNAGDLHDYLKTHRKLPLLINFLFYHGRQSPYPYHNTLQAYYDYPEWGSQELALRFHVIDATQISDEEFLKHGHCAPMCLLLKHGRDGNFELEIDAYRDVFQACVAAVGDEYIFTMLQYAAELSNEKAGKKIFNFIEEVLSNKTEIIMSYGQRLRQEAIKQDRLAIARTMLTKGYDPTEVRTLTGISPGVMIKLKSANKRSTESKKKN